jgi:rare lipoprotein A
MQRIHSYLLAVASFAVIGQAHASLPAAASITSEMERDLVLAEQNANRELDIAETDAANSENVQVAALGAVSTGKKAAKQENGRCRSMSGVASWYDDHRTASGERFSGAALTAAHRTLPFNTHVRVTNLNNGKSVIVKINDRGPYVGGRVIDLTHAGARAIGMDGLAKVSLETCL